MTYSDLTRLINQKKTVYVTQIGHKYSYIFVSKNSRHNTYTLMYRFKTKKSGLEAFQTGNTYGKRCRYVPRPISILIDYGINMYAPLILRVNGNPNIVAYFD